MIDIRKKLNIKIESPYWDAAYSKAISKPMVPEWLTEKYIRSLHNKTGALPKNLEKVVSIIPYVTAVPELCILAKTLYHIIGTKKSFSKVFTKFELPISPDFENNTIAYDCFAIFPVLAHILPTMEELRARCIPDDILFDSLNWVDRIFTEASSCEGKPIFHTEQFKLYSVCIYVNHLSIGSLRFEIYENSLQSVKIFRNKDGEFCPLIVDTIIHKDGYILGSCGMYDEENSYCADLVETTDAYIGYTVDRGSRLVQKDKVILSKEEWEPVCSSGDTVIKVHIPYGSKITKEACNDSYIRAKEVFKRCFPEYRFKCFMICCWMLSPVLKDILPYDSNIVAFQNNYIVFPVRNSALDVFTYVFGLDVKSIHEIEFSNLAENTSLQRGIKKKLMSGELIHQFGGYMPL